MEQTFARELLDFLDASPSCYHAAANVAAALEQAGYWHLMEFEPWHLERGGAYYVMRGDSAVAAFRIPQGPVRGFLLAAGHSDSPTLKLRQEAETASPGNCLRLSVEPYGGGIWRSWLDRPLSVAGRVMVRDGDAIRSRLVNIDRDLLVIPSVAIHMDREVNKKGGLDPARDLSPLFADFDGFPPTLIQVGDHEILYSDSESLYQAMKRVNVPCRLQVSEGMWHVFQMFPMRKAAAAIENVARFLLEQ